MDERLVGKIRCLEYYKLPWTNIVSESPYMTKLMKSSRFDAPYRVHNVLPLPCGGFVAFLSEDAHVACNGLSADKGKYDPAVDVDRHAVVCPLDSMEHHACPAWDAVRRVLEVAKEKGVADDMATIAVDVYGAVYDGRPRWTRIDENNGLAGPILDDIEVVGREGVAQVIAASEECEHRRDDCSDGGNDSCDKSCDVHGGIISKLLRFMHIR